MEWEDDLTLVFWVARPAFHTRTLLNCLSLGITKGSCRKISLHSKRLVVLPPRSKHLTHCYRGYGRHREGKRRRKLRFVFLYSYHCAVPPELICMEAVPPADTD